MKTRILLGLILLTLLATCLAAAAKLRATPKYDRIRMGMTQSELYHVSGCGPVSHLDRVSHTLTDEGTMRIEVDEGGFVVRKNIQPHGPLERLAWLAGWR